MESSLYDLGFAADWSMDLFPGALLTNGAEVCDLGWSVLQEEGEGPGGSPAPGQYSVVESPISEPLQDSIWSECGGVLDEDLAQLSDCGLKGVEGYDDTDDCLQFVSHHDLTLLTPDYCPRLTNTPLLQPAALLSNNILPYPPCSSSIDDFKYEYADISTSHEFQCSPVTDACQPAWQTDEMCIVACDDKTPISLELLLLQQSHHTDIPAELDLGLEPGIDPAQTHDPPSVSSLDPMLGLGEPACLLRDDEILSMLQRLRQTAELSSLAPVLLSLPPVLSPVSAEDCESILSTTDCCPSEALEDTTLSTADSAFGSSDMVDDTNSSCSMLSTDYLHGGLTPKAGSHHRSAARSTAMAPYGVIASPMAPVLKSEHRRQKKKEQNKTAALRYRVKKREEKGVKLSEVETLEERNEELRARAEDLQREIEYLRALLDEIRQP
jgi:hypothetical protein